MCVYSVLTDVVQRAAAEFPIELLGSKAAQVVDGVGPQVQHVVPGERLALLQHHHLGPQKRQLYGCSQSTGARSQHQTLWERVRECVTERKRDIYIYIYILLKYVL